MSNEKEKKGSSGVGILLLLIILLAVAALFYFMPDLIGGGTSNGTSVSPSPSDKPIEATTTVDSKKKTPERIKITVDRKSYILDNKELSLDDIKDKLSKCDKDTIVVIKDDNAVADTYSELIDAVKAAGLSVEESK